MNALYLEACFFCVCVPVILRLNLKRLGQSTWIQILERMFVIQAITAASDFGWMMLDGSTGQLSFFSITC